MAKWEYGKIPVSWQSRHSALLSPKQYTGLLPKQCTVLHKFEGQPQHRFLNMGFVIGSDPYVFAEETEKMGEQIWVYRNWGPTPHKILIRMVYSLTLNIAVKPLLNGKDCVSATTLGGDTVFSQEYGLFQECRLLEFGQECRLRMIQAGKCTKFTRVVYVRGNAVLRANVMLKKGPRKVRYYRKNADITNRRLWEFGFLPLRV